MRPVDTISTLLIVGLMDIRTATVGSIVCLLGVVYNVKGFFLFVVSSFGIKLLALFLFISPRYSIALENVG